MAEKYSVELETARDFILHSISVFVCLFESGKWMSELISIISDDEGGQYECFVLAYCTIAQDSCACIKKTHSVCQ